MLASALQKLDFDALVVPFMNLHAAVTDPAAAFEGLSPTVGIRAVPEFSGVRSAGGGASVEEEVMAVVGEQVVDVGGEVAEPEQLDGGLGVEEGSG